MKLVFQNNPIRILISIKVSWIFHQEWVKKNLSFATPVAMQSTPVDYSEPELDQSTSTPYKVQHPLDKDVIGFVQSNIIIPSNPDQLRHDLLLQLSASEAGNNNTFTNSNALMKEMMKQRIL